MELIGLADLCLSSIRKREVLPRFGDQETGKGRCHLLRWGRRKIGLERKVSRVCLTCLLHSQEECGLHRLCQARTRLGPQVRKLHRQRT